MTITAPPRPQSPAESRRGCAPGASAPQDREALIEEARRRARRRRRRYGACAVLLAAAAMVLALSRGLGGAGTPSPPSAPKQSPANPSGWASGRLAIADSGGTTVVNGDGTMPRVLRAPRSQVTFSPDGRELTYLQPDGRMVSRSLATGETRAIVRIGRLAWAYPRWSPDGSSLAYAFRVGPGRAGIAVIDRDGSNRHVVATTAGADFKWSPDGRWIAYAEFGRVLTKVWLVQPSGGPPRLAITARSPSETGWGGPHFSWSPDGSAIAYVARSGDGSAVVAQRVDGTERRIVVTGEHLSDPQWSPDGQVIAFNRGDNLILHRLASGAETVVARGGWAQQWSPDGRWIAFFGGASGSVNVVSRDGARRHQVADLLKPEIIVWGPSPA